MVKQRLRPQRSLSLLQGIIRIAMISKKRVIAACTPVTVVSRSAVMSLIITFMFEPAKLQMNCASASGARNRRRAAAPVPLSDFRASVTSAPLTSRRGGLQPRGRPSSPEWDEIVGRGRSPLVGRTVDAFSEDLFVDEPERRREQ